MRATSGTLSAGAASQTQPPFSSATKELCDYFEEAMRHTSNAKSLCNWLTVEFTGRLKETGKTLREWGIEPKPHCKTRPPHRPQHHHRQDRKKHRRRHDGIPRQRSRTNRTRKSRLSTPFATSPPSSLSSTKSYPKTPLHR